MKADINYILKQFKKMIHSNGVTADFSLTNGETFSVLTSGINRAPAELTAGLQQDRVTIRVMGEDWHAHASRRPERGDRATIGGIKHAVDTARPALYQDVLVGYVMTLRG